MKNDYVVVPDLAQSDIAGAVVYWRLSGNLDIENNLAVEKLPEEMRPTPPTPHIALSRAVDVNTNKFLFARPMEDARGWTMVEQAVEEGSETPTFRVHATVALNDEKSVVGKSFTESGENIIAAIRAAYVMASVTLTTTDVSGWLSRMMRQIDAAALRDTGGVYFVPSFSLPTLEMLNDVVRSQPGSQIHQIPALRTEDAVAAILAAVERETTVAIESVESDLDRGVGSRALETRARMCEALRAKVKKYEALLGTSLETLTTRVQHLEAQIVTATLAAQT